MLRPSSRSSAIIAASVLGLVLQGCSAGAPTGPRPKASLGQSGSSQLEFRELSRAWHAADATDRLKLEKPLRGFLAQYPRDELRRPARVYLGWILIQKGELVEAHELISETTRGPLGVAQDFALVAEAALLTHHGRSSEAMKLLRPLHGKIIDPIERFLATEQLVHSAMAAEYYDEALLYSVDWIQHAPEREREQVRAAALSLLHRVPRHRLERALLTLEPPSDGPELSQATARYAEQQWLYDAVSRRLASIAVAEQDVELAQRVLTHSPGVARAAEDPEELVRLATGGDVGLNVSSRTIGLLLTTENSQTRKQSSEVAATLSASLRARNSDFKVIFRQDDGSNTREALQELAAGGAALIVAGVDINSAISGALYSKESKIPILLLQPVSKLSPLAFTLGVSFEEQTAALSPANPVGGIDQVVGSAACSAEPARFPFQEWKATELGSLWVLADAECTRDLAEGLRRHRLAPTLALGLEAAAARNAFQLGPLVFLQAGHYPESAAAPQDMVDFANKRGRSPTWFETLGHDAATIAQEVLEPLPDLSSSEVAQVEALYQKLQQALVNYTSRSLWSSEAARFDSSRRLVRTLSYKRRLP